MPLIIVVTSKDSQRQQYVFESDRISIGRDPANDLVLRESNVSKEHALIVVRQEQLILQDLNSTNGTWINNQRIRASQLVTDRDRILIGDFGIRLEFTDMVPEMLKTDHDAPTTIPASGGNDEPLFVSDSGEDDLPQLEERSEEPRRRQSQPQPQQSRPRSYSGQLGTSSAWPKLRHWGAPSTSDPEDADRLDALLQAAPLDSIVPTTGPSRDERHGPRRMPYLKREARTQEIESFRDVGEEVHKLLLDVVSHSIQLAPSPRSTEGYSLDYDSVLHAGSEAVLSYETQLGEPLPEEYRHQVIRLVGNELIGLGPIELYLEWPDVLGIEVHAFDRVMLRKREGLEPAPLSFITQETYIRAVERLARSMDNVADRGGGQILLQPDFAIDLLLPPLVPACPSLTLRRRRSVAYTPSGLVSAGVLSQYRADVLVQHFRDGHSIVFLGQNEEHLTAMIRGLIEQEGMTRSFVRISSVSDMSARLPNCIDLVSLPNDPELVLQRAIGLRPNSLVIEPMQRELMVPWLLSQTTHNVQSLWSLSVKDRSSALERLELLASIQAPSLSEQQISMLLKNSIDLLVYVDSVEGNGEPMVPIVAGLEIDESRDLSLRAY